MKVSYKGQELLYILFGADDFSLHEELEKIKAGLGELVESNITFFDGHQLRLNQLMYVCYALPFLGSYRLIIVDGVLERFQAAEEAGAFKEAVARMPPTTVLVLIDGEIKRDSTLLRELSPLATVREFPRLRGAALRDWMARRVAQRGGSISPQALKLIADLVGDNLWLVASEIEKLLLYCSGRRIEEEDVERVVSYARVASVFTMVDALIEGRASTAAPLLHQLLDEGATAPYLLVMITRQLRLMVQAKELTLKGMPTSRIKERLGLASDYVLTKALGQSRRYSMKRLEQVYRKLLETDLAIKRGMWKGELALDLLIAELCHG